MRSCPSPLICRLHPQGRRISQARNSAKQLFLLTTSCLFLASLISWPGRWRRHLSSKTSVDFWLITRGYIPQGRTLYNHICENLKSDEVKKGKEILVTGRGGPLGCEKSRLQRYLDQRLTDGGKVVSPACRRMGIAKAIFVFTISFLHNKKRTGRPLPLGFFFKIPGINSC
jgi:hypothetical protein